ncbi:cysteine-rich receptor-like protein kinase 27 [Pistacia vera]|uniref:cysteine-rich receptor-like protein kinase 27 n=1 Tax=Pistacia vera TaxID=55513 RepID=UPI00126304AA|nr:cysteine-rich receptor-like protein kinase 27 [Pistacia vera]
MTNLEDKERRHVFGLPESAIAMTGVGEAFNDSCGYMSPEYALQGLFSVKSDSFYKYNGKVKNLITSKVLLFFGCGNCGEMIKLWSLDLMDPVLVNEASYPILIRYIEVALLCVQENATNRPTMSEVVSMLTK